LKYEKTKQKKNETEAENKQLIKEIVVLNDSLSVMIEEYQNLKPYNEQITEIESLKKEFLHTRVPYYLELKKRQEVKIKNLKK
jgi:hypothetical protein